MKWFTLTRNVLRTECDWLPRDLAKGDKVILHEGATYGAISNAGIAVLIDEGGPFYEVPIDAVTVRP